MSATAHPAYLELIDFIAGGTTPEALIAFRPSREVQDRVSSLIAREHEGQLTDEDQQELADYLQLEHLMIMAKAQARRKLQLGS
jgi:S-adenosylmethionine:tRNA-ribosyltransferase-isomerase (queuine synthetase)